MCTNTYIHVHIHVHRYIGVYMLSSIYVHLVCKSSLHQLPACKLLHAVLLCRC